MKDIRVVIGFLHHHKNVKLQRRHGAEGILALIQLWQYAAQYHCKGVFDGMDAEEIVIAAQWNGGVDWVDSLTEFRLLDQSNDGVYSIHNWREHNGFAFYSAERKAQATEAVNARWGKEKRAKKQKPNTDRITGRNSECNTPSPPPSPLPTNCIGTTEDRVQEFGQKKFRGGKE